jgi:hypothetical protein
MTSRLYSDDRGLIQQSRRPRTDAYVETNAEDAKTWFVTFQETRLAGGQRLVVSALGRRSRRSRGVQRGARGYAKIWGIEFERMSEGTAAWRALVDAQISSVRARLHRNRKTEGKINGGTELGCS